MNINDFKIDYESGIVNRGNQSRFKELFKRAKKGEKLTLGFLGGSITQGFNASSKNLCYAYHVYEWWCNTFPDSCFQYVNAGIGATDSQFACARAESDLLQYKPDFVIIEYSVNDAPTDHYMETYEGIVRKIYTQNWKPAILLVHNVCYDNGSSAQLIHSKVARYYQIPAVSMQSTIYKELLAGRIENRWITDDDLHPNDCGHELVASVITYLLEKILMEVNQPEVEAVFPMKPLTLNQYEKSVRYQNFSCSPILNGFQKDETVQEGITDIFKNGWIASKKGDSITFEIEGSCIGVQYRKTIHLPAPVAKMIIDGDEENAIILDANFEETWGDWLYLGTALEHGENKKHTVEIRLVETHKDDKLPFYLVSLIGSM